MAVVLCLVIYALATELQTLDLTSNLPCPTMILPLLFVILSHKIDSLTLRAKDLSKKKRKMSKKPDQQGGQQ